MSSTYAPQHPLDPISPDEIKVAAKSLQKHLQTNEIHFKVIDLIETPKATVLAWIEQRHGLPERRSRIYFHANGSHVLGKAEVNLTKGVVDSIKDLPDTQGPADPLEIERVHDACDAHPQVKAEIAKLNLPKGARVVNDPWCFGTDDAKERRRLYQCYMYIVLNEDKEANHYSLPASFSPVFDAHTLELLWIDQLPLGSGKETRTDTVPWEPVPAVEYSAGVLGDNYFRKDVKSLQVKQPEGASFTVEGRTVSWQKWNFQLGWNYREGPVLHNVTYDGRSLFFRIAMSEMTVPYGDPRSPFHRKQAFDLGDTGLGTNSNTLTLGCDCLGHIRYFDGYRAAADGTPVIMKNVVCMHEIDQGIGWKHTNWRNGEASVVRDRQLVIQCTATVANYEYILAFILDQAANLHVETKATGIVSTMPIRQGVLATKWGTVVAPGVMATNHQHIFSVRIDPALDGHNNTIVYDDCVPVEDDPELDPYGCAFEVRTTKIQKPGGYDLNTNKSRVYKIINPSIKNPISGKAVGYKLHAIPSQMMMMSPRTFNWKRGIFGSKPIWVTKYRDEELWAAGEFTNQSREDTGLAIWANRDEEVEDSDVVLWHTFAITHVTRPEGKRLSKIFLCGTSKWWMEVTRSSKLTFLALLADFPVMPTEKMMLSLKPTNFFSVNPSNDVPRSNQKNNKSTLENPSDTLVINQGHCQSLL